MTTKEFIEKAKLKHSNKYEYDKTKYIKSQEKVIITCDIHGDFEMTPNAHLNGQGCPKCGKIQKTLLQTKTTNEFMQEAKLKFGDKYDYSKAQYINGKTKICVICPIHGEFWVIPNKHLHRGDGCKKCSGKESLTIETFISRANKIHNNKYDYSKVNYVNSKSKICIICPQHGEFWQTPNKHLSGQGCPKCRYIKSADSKRRSLKEVIQFANNIHEGQYDYSLITKYKNDRIKYPIICKEHGIFYQTMNNHIQFKQGCPICGRIKSDEGRKYTNEEWIQKAKDVHKDKYDYSKVNYIDSKHKVMIICPKHGEFEQIPSNHLFGQGCPICKQSKLENDMEDFLISKDIEFIKQKKFDWLKYKRNMSLDFYLPKYKVAIECQGKQHFLKESFNGEPFEIIIERDKKKRDLCYINNVKLIYYSDLGIDYPYEVFENKEDMLKEILREWQEN